MHAKWSPYWFPVTLLLFILLTALPVLVAADDYIGGIPLTTVQTGTVTGNLWMDVNPAPNWGSQNVVKTFTLPAAAVAAPGRIRWARLYVSAYCGHMQDDKAFTMTNSFDGNGDGTYEQVWPELTHKAFTYITNGGNDNQALGGGPHDPFVMLNDHETRVTSDYLAYYDVTNLITSRTVNVNVKTTGFDGRIKVISLLVAYDDPASTTKTTYWVNQGHDVCSYYTEDYLGEACVGTTTFGTTGLSGITSAKLTIDYMASHNGEYGFPYDSNDFVPTGVEYMVDGSFLYPLNITPDIQGPYSGVASWDVTGDIDGSGDVTFAYARAFGETGTSAFYKIPLAILVVKKAAPVAAFSADDTTPAVGQTVIFTDASGNTPTGWAWTISGTQGTDYQYVDPTSSTSQNPHVRFLKAGSYDVSLTATNSGGSDTATKTGYITATAPSATPAPPAAPVAAFAANSTSGPAPFTVRFTDQSTGAISSYAWDFTNDGTVDTTTQSPSFTYSAAGTYTVNLTVMGPGGSDTEIKTGYITVTAPSAAPVANFTADVVNGTAPLTVRFADQSTGTVSSYSWDFMNDGSVDSTEQNPAFTYSTAGTYTVNLTVIGPGGSDTDVKTGFITVTSGNILPSGPVAAFTASTTSGTAPLAVQFTDQSTGNPHYWQWTFGDNSPISKSRNASHTYTNPGTYTVSLDVSDKGSTWSAPASQSIAVYTLSGVPGVSFTASPTSGVAPLTVRFSDSSSGSPTSWAWDFENNGTIDSTEQNPIYTYTSAGTYTVTLNATNAAGSGSLTKSNYIAVTVSATSPDLTVESIVPNLGSVSAMNVFALEKNPVTIKIANGGNGSSAATMVKLVSSDGFSGTAPVPALDGGANTTVVVTDTKERPSDGVSLTYTATVDPTNTVPESNENNNAKTGSAITVKYNGYKGMRYWAGEGDITTKHTFDLNGSLLYSRGDSEYRSGSFGDAGWLSYTVRWTPDDLPIPTGATVKAAYLYVPYTWDNAGIAPDHTFIDFNDARITRSSWYSDQSNFGVYADYKYGLLTYDVTPEFKKNNDNRAVFTRENPAISDPAQAAVYTKLSMYEFFLVVIYADPDESEKQIFINEGFDLLGAGAAYGTTPAEATAYVPFTGMTIDTQKMKSATLVTFVPSGDSNEGNILYNGNVIARNVWSWGGSGTGADGGHQVAEDTRAVTSNIKSTGNTFAIQSTDLGDTATPCMVAAQQFLIVDYGGSTNAFTVTTTTPTPTPTTNTTPTPATNATPTPTTTTDTTPTPTINATPVSAAAMAAQAGGGSRPGLTANPTGLQAVHADETPNATGNRAPGSSRSSPMEPISTVAFSGISVIGTGLAFAYQKGWIPIIPIGRVAAARGDPFLNIDARIGAPVSRTGPDEDSVHLTREPGSENKKRKYFFLIGCTIAGLVLVGCVWTFGLLPFHSSAPSASPSTPITAQGGSFELVPTVEDIQDRDMTNHVPDYPSGFSARNGLLIVNQGKTRYRISDLELDLRRGTEAVTITSSTVLPPVTSANPPLTSYFEEMGNGNGVLDPGEWLMVYADNCYDSSQASDEPRGRVLVWQPWGTGSKLELLLKDSINYSLKNRADGTVLQQGTLSFVPATP